jgi:hypothetical protein
MELAKRNAADCLGSGTASGDEHGRWSKRDLSAIVDHPIKNETPKSGPWRQDAATALPSPNSAHGDEARNDGQAVATDAGRSPNCRISWSGYASRLSVAKIRWADNNADDLLLDWSAFNSQSRRRLKHGSSNNSDSRGAPLREKRSRLLIT